MMKSGDKIELSEKEREHLQFLASKYVINIVLAKDNEPRKIFIGDGRVDWHIQRGVDVTVPGTVLEALNNAVVGVTEQDPDDETKVIHTERSRFPYSVKKVIPADEKAIQALAAMNRAAAAEAAREVERSAVKKAA
jgi:adenylate kinase